MIRSQKLGCTPKERNISCITVHRKRPPLTHCIKNSIIKYKCSLNPSSCDEKIPASVQKQSLFLKALDHIDPLLEKGYGFTVSDITVYIGTLKKGNHILQNRDVKQLFMTTMVIKYSLRRILAAMLLS